MSKHTPGPWEYRWNGHYFDVGILNDDSIVPIFPAVCIGVQAGLVGNACLIAAAPELLRSLKAAMAFIDSHVADPDITEEMCEAYAALQESKPHTAISKAEGAQ